MPSATAPLETSTTALLRRLSSAICSAQRASAAWSSPWPSLVTRLLPTLTTRRLASAAIDFIALRRSGLSGVFSAFCKFGSGVSFQVFHDRESELAPPLPGERRNHKGFLWL